MCVAHPDPVPNALVTTDEPIETADIAAAVIATDDLRVPDLVAEFRATGSLTAFRTASRRAGTGSPCPFG